MKSDCVQPFITLNCIIIIIFNVFIFLGPFEIALPMLEFHCNASSLETAAAVADCREAQSNRGLANLPCLNTRDQSRRAAAALEGHFSI